MYIFRALLALTALTLAYIGFGEARLKIHCPTPLDLDASSLTAMVDDPGPVWARLEAALPKAKPAMLTTESGTLRGVWLPVTGAKDPGTVVAVLNLDSLDDARSFRASKAPLLLEGLASLPSRENAVQLRNYFVSSGFRWAPGFRVLEVGRKPHGLLGSVILITIGIAGAIASLRGMKFPRFQRRSEVAPGVTALEWTKDPQEAPAGVDASLADEIKVQVYHMVSEVWNRV